MTEVSNARHTIRNPNESFEGLTVPDLSSESSQGDSKVSFKAKATYFVKTYTAGVGQDGRLYIFHRGGNVYLDHASSKHLTSQKLLPQILCHDSTPTIIKVRTLAASQTETRKEVLSRFSNQALCAFCQSAIASKQIQQFSSALKYIYTQRQSNFIDLLVALSEDERSILMSLPEFVGETEILNSYLTETKKVSLATKMTRQEKQNALAYAVIDMGDFVEKESSENEASWSYIELPATPSSTPANLENANSSPNSDSQVLLLRGFSELLLPTSSSGLLCNFDSAHQNAVLSVYLSLPDPEKNAFLCRLSDETLKAQLEYLFRSLNRTLEVRISDETIGAKVSTKEWKEQLLGTFKHLPQERQIAILKCLDRELQVHLLNGLSSMEIDESFIEQLAVELSSDEIVRLISPESHNRVFGGDLSTITLSEKVIEDLIRSLSIPKATYLYCISPDNIKSRVIETNEEVMSSGFKCIFDEVICFLMSPSEAGETNDKTEQVYSFEKVMKFVEIDEFKAYTKSLYGSPDKLKFIFDKLEKHVSHSILQTWFGSDLDHFCQIYQCIDSEFLTEEKKTALEINLFGAELSINGCFSACRLLPLNYAQKLYFKMLDSSETGLNEELIQATKSLSQYPSFLPRHLALLSRLAKDLNGGEKLNSLLYLLFTGHPQFQSVAKVLSKEQWKEPAVVDYCISELSDSDIQQLLIEIDSSEICNVFISSVQPKTRQDGMYCYIAQHKPKLFLELFSKAETGSRKGLINVIPSAHKQTVLTYGIEKFDDFKGALAFLLISELEEEQKYAAFKAITSKSRANLIEQISQCGLSQTEVDTFISLLSRLYEEGSVVSLPIEACHYLLSVRPKQAAFLIFEKLDMNVFEVLKGYKNTNIDVIVEAIFETIRKQEEFKHEEVLKILFAEICKLENISDEVLISAYRQLKYKERIEVLSEYPDTIKRLDSSQFHKPLSKLIIVDDDQTETENSYRQQKDLFSLLLNSKQFFVNLLANAESGVVKYVEENFDQTKLIEQLLQMEIGIKSSMFISSFSFIFLDGLLKQASAKENQKLVALVISDMYIKTLSSTLKAKGGNRLLKNTILPKINALNPHQTLTLFGLLSIPLQIEILNQDDGKAIVDKVEASIVESEASVNLPALEEDKLSFKGTLRSRTGTMAQSYIGWTLDRKGLRETDRNQDGHTKETLAIVTEIEKLDLTVLSCLLAKVEPSVCKQCLYLMSKERAIEVIPYLPDDPDGIRLPYYFAAMGNKQVVDEVLKWAQEINKYTYDATGELTEEYYESESYNALIKYSDLLAEIVPGLSDEVLFGIIDKNPELAWVLFPIKFEFFNILKLQEHLEFTQVEKIVKNTPESSQAAILDVAEPDTFIEVVPKLSSNVLALFTHHYRDDNEAFNKLCNCCGLDKRAELIASGIPELLPKYNANFGEDAVIECFLAEVKKEEVERFLLHMIRNKIGLKVLAKKLDDESFDLESVFTLFSKLKKNDTTALFKLITNGERKKALRKILKV
ncbi:hypothetical protein SOPP22_12450 [Shewanella sp. OPT22]|nr:hypothetical protein SOPP22_12450 [Shewanella sp. OPT22]